MCGTNTADRDEGGTAKGDERYVAVRKTRETKRGTSLPCPRLAMSGTLLRYQPTLHVVLIWRYLPMRALRCAICGTDLLYHPTHLPVLDYDIATYSRAVQRPEP
eukprot:2211181-Rhodomonas_salina.2